MQRKHVKRLVATVLAGAILLSSLTGWNKKEEPKASPSPVVTDDSTGGSDPVEKERDYSEMLTLDVFDGLANFQGIQSGWFAKVIKDKFNIELNIIAPNVAGGGDTLFQTRSANGELGDIIITSLDQSRLKDMVQAGLILDMTEYLNGCDNLKSYQSVIEETSTLADEKGLWAVPSELSNQSAVEPCEALESTVAPSLRWDVYKKIGYPKMSNLDDLLDTLEKMQEAADPSDSGKKAYALSLFKDWDGDVMQNADGIKGLYGYNQVGFCMAKVDGTDIQSVIDDDGIYVRTLKFYFDANQRGILDPESTTQDFTTDRKSVV